MSNATFDSLGVAEPILRALKEEGYTTPTPIQLQAIPTLLDGRDMLGIAQTGTGKTAAFAVPILQLLSIGHEAPKPRQAKALILAPTRELAIQIADSFGDYGKFLGIRRTVILGGVKQGAQVKAMARGVDVLIATPGRLLDLVNQGHIDLSAAHTLVLDEADRMLDMGFIHDVKKIMAKLPKKRQSLLFSATMPGEVAKLSNSILNNPVRVEITPKVVTVDLIKQQVYFVEGSEKKDALLKVMEDPSLERVIIFTRTKHRANRVADILDRKGHSSVAIHGNKSQNARQKALGQFKSGEARILVATDIAARGIDVDDVTHVINFELPNEPESYVHRIGRTARAGARGTAISFCEATEVGYLEDIEKLTKKPIEVAFGDKPAAKKPIRNGGGGGGGGRGKGGRGGGRNAGPASANNNSPRNDGGRPKKNRRSRNKGGRPGGNQRAA